jgi:hypothetical protein
MAKKASAEQIPAPDVSSSVAIKRGDYDDLVAKVANANNTMDAARERKSELIANAVTGKNLHKGAFAWIMRLRKMDPVKRNEFLFHFDVMCDYEKFAREDLLPDRADVNGVKRGTDEDGEPDLRPSYLRQPGASASDEAVNKIKEDALSKVGRGNPPSASKH